MKKIYLYLSIIILFIPLFIDGCVVESGLPVSGILTLCLIAIIICSFILFKRNRSLSSLNNDLEQIISDKTEELKKQNLVISMNNSITRDHNTDLEKIIEAKAEELCQKDAMILLNSRLATMGEMIGFIGHQWKQNIYAISLYVEAMKNILLQKGSLDIKTAKDPLERIDSFIIEMYNNLNDFTDFVKPKNDVEYFSITDSLEETLNLMRDLITINSVVIKRDYKDQPSLYGFSNELKQVLMNIIKNAIDAFEERNSKERIIILSIHRDEEMNFITIKDSAGGVLLENPDEVFNKFYTSKDDGTGLGLYLSRIVIEQRFNGKIEVQNMDGGACFTISIPVFTEDTVF
jgi:C4-dicarboxylate-specific signal transduction histidine kinase